MKALRLCLGLMAVASILLGSGTAMPDPVGDAGTLLAQCSAIDKDAAPLCSRLATKVANGADPSVGLPTVDRILPGDLHLMGPWKAAIVIRNKAAFAVSGGTTGPNIAVTTVDNAESAAALMSGQGTSSAPAAFEPGWITEAHPIAVPDGSQTSPDVISRYIAGDPSAQYMGEHNGTIPLHANYLFVQYVRRGLFNAARQGEYQFAATYLPPQIPAIQGWECWTHITFIDAGKRISTLPNDPIEFEFNTPPARIKTLVSTALSIPRGLNAIEVDGLCNPGSQWDANAFGAALHENSGFIHTAGAWPVLEIRVRRPGEAVYSRLRQDEIFHDGKGLPPLRTAAAEAAEARQPGSVNPLAVLNLPSNFKPGWYVDVYPILGTAQESWAQPPQGPLQATFIAQPAGFSLIDHRRAGMADKDGKIYVANSEFLALKTGRYTFLVDADNPAVLNGKGYDRCVIDLGITDKQGGEVHIIDGSRPNSFYTAGRFQFSQPAVGGAELGRGAYRMSLRAACAASGEADISANPFAAARFTVLVRNPDQNTLHPANPGAFVYRRAK